MALNPLSFDNKYFQKAYERNDTLKAADFDRQFNILVDYLNKQMMPIINNLGVGSITGSVQPNDIDKFYKNVGDGTITFDNLSTVNFNDYSISWNRLVTANTGSILVSSSDQNIKAVVPSDKDQILVSVLNNEPLWDKVAAENILNRSIDGVKVALGSIPASKIYPGTLGTQLTPEVITTEKIIDRAVTTSKFADGAFNALVLGNDLTFTLLNTLSTERIPDNYITNVTLSNYNFQGFADFNSDMIQSAFDTTIKIPHIKFDYSNSGFRFDTNPILAPKLITSNKIKHGSINAKRLLINIGQGRKNPIPNEIIANGAITPEVLPMSWRRRLGL